MSTIREKCRVSLRISGGFEEQQVPPLRSLSLASAGVTVFLDRSERGPG